MRFCHFYDFNIGMHGKQGWNLLKNKDALLSKILKQKLPRGWGIFGGTVGYNPCFVWRSIHNFQVLVQQAMRWKVGNGENNCISNESWLRRNEHPCGTTEMTMWYEHLTMSELTNRLSKTWRTDLIRSISGLARCCKFQL